jgi:hypothetical protein
MPEPTSMVWADGNYVVHPDNYFICVRFNNAVVTLPSATGNYGKSLVIKNTRTVKTTTIQAMDGQTIDGQATFVTTKLWEFVPLRSDGSNWLIMS